mmetsp:Transcript_9528/g.19069  ORF Transcript_9528/g.19069 Transcript_9528/m.19069 type:complete len:226 (+) Transcript_9528:133-810(+)
MCSEGSKARLRGTCHMRIGATSHLHGSLSHLNRCSLTLLASTRGSPRASKDLEHAAPAHAVLFQMLFFPQAKTSVPIAVPPVLHPCPAVAYHCSPTSSFLRCLPRRFRRTSLSLATNREGSNGFKSTHAACPSRINSEMAMPVTGAQRMPQQLCPEAMYALFVLGICPRRGRASGGQGRRQACAMSTLQSAIEQISPKDFSAATTRLGFASTFSGESSLICLELR